MATVEPQATPFAWGFGTTADANTGIPVIIMQFADCTGTKIYFMALEDFRRFAKEAREKENEFSGGLIIAQEMPSNGTR